jgi:hypothetical protein
MIAYVKAKAYSMSLSPSSPIRKTFSRGLGFVMKSFSNLRRIGQSFGSKRSFSAFHLRMKREALQMHALPAHGQGWADEGEPFVDCGLSPSDTSSVRKSSSIFQMELLSSLFPKPEAGVSPKLRRQKQHTTLQTTAEALRQSQNVPELRRSPSDGLDELSELWKWENRTACSVESSEIDSCVNAEMQKCQVCSNMCCVKDYHLLAILIAI